MSKTASGLSPAALHRAEIVPSRAPWHPLIPNENEIVQVERAQRLEAEIREGVRNVTDVEVLVPVQDQLNRLATALAGTKPGTYVRAAARRVEWQIGQLLGPPPGAGEHNKTESNANDSVVTKDEAYLFRLVGTLDIPWDEPKAWDESRNRLVKTAKERRRQPVEGDPEIRRGDFREVLADIPDGSVSLILTDPPYADANLPLYVDLAKFAADKLESGGSLICYTGHTILPAVLPAMSEHLRYWWLMALEHTAGGRQLPGKWVWVGWKPVMWFVKDTRRDNVYVRDVIRGVKPDKSLHEWAQGMDEVLPLLERLTNPGELVCDPFAGSGSFGHAALKIGRRFVGADSAASA